MAQIGEKIRRKREELGMTQEELAKKLGYKNKSTIAKIETGINDITQSKVCDFANVLNTTIAYLMGWEDENGFAALSEKENEQTESSRTTYKDLPLTEKEKQLVEFFRQLNIKGKERMLEDAEMYTMLAMYCQKEEVE